MLQKVVPAPNECDREQTMHRINAEVAIIGSSFAGSLLALILRRQGINVVLLDRDTHPRFAIGESSTPAADLILGDLCERYNLPQLKPLSKYGSWQTSHPEICCGLKRGFSYFHHKSGQDFRQDELHSNELLVTASASDDVGDTHWYRADVDAFFAAEARMGGVTVLEGFDINGMEREGDWTVRGVHSGDEMEVRARFVVDSSGNGAVLPRQLKLADRTDELETDSWCMFAHFSGVRRWSDVLRECGGSVQDHPFDCDAAALHHILDGAWMWVLPFNDDITSVGLVLDRRQHPVDDRIPPEQRWRSCLDRYPSLESQFGGAELVHPFGSLRTTGRLQRMCAFGGADNWTLLPGTAGFVDPFYSTGIAHSLSGVERVARAFEVHDDQPQFHTRLEEHAGATSAELHLIDRLVAGAYRTFGRHPALLNHISMLYFAAATTWERRRIEGTQTSPATFLLADQPDWLARVDRCLEQLSLLVESDGQESIASFAGTIATAIASYNTAGLCQPEVRNMYRYTSLPV